MIAGLSKAVTLYLAPLLMLTSLILSLFALLAPTLLLHDQVSLLMVSPSAALTQSGSTKGVDGPSVFIGVLGSCARTNGAASVNCTALSISPQYDLSVLPSSSPNLLLSAPTASAPVFMAISILLSTLFFIMFTLISFRHKMGGKISVMLDKPLLPRASAWIGCFGFLIGLTSFLILRMWFGKAVQDFNASIAAQGQQGPELIASTGNAFTMAWVAYAFFAVPIISSMTKLNITAAKNA
ncbi:hypothetical protein D9613_001816 [Agrocybe pediades]|uniref:Uncharacterized protein n=1 Tax=Agrocybe pediades TaxID=84607 RepID=A0A8H4R710_9AGAR|nr:hypothetical protein D9613_001816 [Agrocybe pediades]